MIQQILRRFLSLFLSAVLIVTLLPVISVPALAAVSGELSGLTNKDVGASYSGSDDGSYTSWSVIGGNGITGTAKSKDGGACGSDTKHNTTLTLTNNKDTAAILSFDYKVTRSGGTIQVAGSSVTEDGSYSATIDAGSSIKIYLESGDTNNETKIEIANLSMIVDTSVTTTFQPAENGSYTVDGESITEERVKTQQSTVAYSCPPQRMTAINSTAGTASPRKNTSLWMPRHPCVSTVTRWSRRCSSAKRLRSSMRAGPASRT